MLRVFSSRTECMIKGGTHHKCRFNLLTEESTGVEILGSMAPLIPNPCVDPK